MIHHRSTGLYLRVRQEHDHGGGTSCTSLCQRSSGNGSSLCCGRFDKLCRIGRGVTIDVESADTFVDPATRLGRNPPNREWFDNGRVIPQYVELFAQSKWNTLYNNVICFTLFIGTAVAALSGCAGTTASVEPGANPLPVPFGTDAVPASLLPEAAAPSGNMSFCKPSGAGLNTVVLVNLAMTSQGPAWQTEAPFLSNNGYCLYAFGFEQISGVPEALALTAEYVESFARTVAETVNRVLADTGASKVDLVGHAEGDGIIPGYYINRLDGAIDRPQRGDCGCAGDELRIGVGGRGDDAADPGFYNWHGEAVVRSVADSGPDAG